MFPQADWQWSFDSAHRKLCCQLGEQGKLCLSIDPRKLIPDAKKQTAFTLEQTQDYMAWMDRLGDSGFNQQQCLLIILNGIAAKYFTQPVMPKNWLFQNQHNNIPFSEGQLVELVGLTESGVFLTISKESDCSLFMLLDQELPTKDKSLTCFSLVKVSNQFALPIA